MITGTEDRQHGYVALSRGTETNMAYVFTGSPKLADPMPGPRPAPELARYDRITAERVVQPPAPAAEIREALAVLSGVLDRDGQQLSASQRGPWPMLITWPSCTRSGPTRPPRPASSITAICSRPTCHPSTGASSATRPDGCGAPCAPPNWRPGPRRSPGRCDRRTGPGRRTRPGRRHRRPYPVPDPRPRPSPDGPMVVPSPRHHRRRTPRVSGRGRRADGRPQGSDR